VQTCVFLAYLLSYGQPPPPNKNLISLDLYLIVQTQVWILGSERSKRNLQEIAQGHPHLVAKCQRELVEVEKLEREMRKGRNEMIRALLKDLLRFR
jgi:hypothetical protein